MQEVFEKIKNRIMITATEACGYTPMTRVISEAELKEIVEDADAEYNNGWISCSKRLPEPFDNVLISTKEGGRAIAHRCPNQAFGRYYDLHGSAIDNVIAWQPLPQPYNPNICISDCQFNDKKGCTAAEGCAGFEQKKQTNADRIRFMSDEELAEFILKNCDNPISEVNEDMCDFCDNSEGESECDDESCKRAIVKWLQSEVEE